MSIIVYYIFYSKNIFHVFALLIIFLNLSIAYFYMIGSCFWDLNPLFELKPPKPRNVLICPFCFSKIFYFKRVVVFKRSENQYRIDISIKCHRCGYVPTFGIHISKHTYDKIFDVFKRNGFTNGVLEYFHLSEHWLVSPVYTPINNE